MRGILFDLPAVVARAEPTLVGAGVRARCDVVGGNFFSSVPAGGDAYVLRHVLHDWNDDQAVTILRRCRDAAGPKGKILVVENVIPHGNEPCFGKWLDLMMLVVGGYERTEEHYRRLFAGAGLRLSRVVPTSADVSVVEAVCAVRSAPVSAVAGGSTESGTAGR